MSSAGDGILRGVLDRPRAIVLSWAALCFVLFALLGVGVATDWGWLVWLDDRGQSAEEWATDVDWLHRAARWSRSPSGRSR